MAGNTTVNRGGYRKRAAAQSRRLRDRIEGITAANLQKKQAAANLSNAQALSLLRPKQQQQQGLGATPPQTQEQIIAAGDARFGANPYAKYRKRAAGGMELDPAYTAYQGAKGAYERGKRDETAKVEQDYRLKGDLLTKQAGIKSEAAAQQAERVKAARMAELAEQDFQQGRPNPGATDPFGESRDYSRIGAAAPQGTKPNIKSTVVTDSDGNERVEYYDANQPLSEQQIGGSQERNPAQVEARSYIDSLLGSDQPSEYDVSAEEQAEIDRLPDPQAVPAQTQPVQQPQIQPPNFGAAQTLGSSVDAATQQINEDRARRASQKLQAQLSGRQARGVRELKKGKRNKAIDVLKKNSHSRYNRGLISKEEYDRIQSMKYI
jgi:hypothetical protein